ncbi:uncharacterized protein LOC112042473 [Lingula anatina]|uniref:Uncharacterized protein LOC112042473 n=1 Tax=Lingula anatina TaxID=7574 RepID=A0A2R2MRG0_LINAN|nr:uncharacterized protein LOC112042473 [Lingula anatina]|eukprot:XP_023932836.1 uncharacterized protein LOC112042473 [Lingula anatina]
MAYCQMKSTVMSLRRCLRCRRTSRLPVLLLMTGALIYIFQFMNGFEILSSAVAKAKTSCNLMAMNRSDTSGEIIHRENKKGPPFQLTEAMAAIRSDKSGSSKSPTSTSCKEESLSSAQHDLGQHQNTTSDFVLVWSHYAAIPQTFMDKMETLLQFNPGKRVIFFCGSSGCIDQIDAKAWKHVTAFRLLLSELTQGTPLDDFVSKSAFLKLLLGRKFMAVVHEVSVLLVLWRFGGLHINLIRMVPSNLPDEYFTGEWVSTEGIFFISRFERHSLFVKSAMVEIQSAYSSLSRSQIQNWDTASVLIKSKVLSQLDERQFEKDSMGSVMPFLQDEHFGILTFDNRVKVARDINDEIQTLAGLQFLPFVDLLVDRDTWNVTSVVKLIPQSENTDIFSEENTKREIHGKATNWSLYMTRNAGGIGISKTKDTKDHRQFFTIRPALSTAASKAPDYSGSNSHRPSSQRSTQQP